MNWGYHIKKLREDKGMTQADLAVKSGLGRGHIARIESGSYKGTRQETFQRLARGLGLSIIELNRIIRGEKPFVTHRETPEETLERIRINLPESVPIYEEFPFHAGEPVEPLDYVAIVKDRARGKNLEGYFVHGDCLEPHIKSGDIIIIDRDGQVEHGDVVACLVDGQLHLARLRKIADEIYLESNHGKMKLEEDTLAFPVIEIRRRLK